MERIVAADVSTSVAEGVSMKTSEDSAFGADRARLTRLTQLTRLNRRRFLRASGLAGGSAMVAGLAPLRRSSARGALATNDCSPADGSLPAGITSVMKKPRYAKSTWHLLVVDVATGETVYELDPDKMALTASVRKLFSVGLALTQFGTDHRFTTPVYRQGKVDDQGVLAGDLILVAAGDLTLGGRLNDDGTIAYTDFDHNDANNLGTAILPSQDPLHGLDSLARQVRAAGITTVSGQIAIDDRLFDSFRVPNQKLLITPMMVNENMVDVTVTPAQVGQPAAVTWRPETGAFRVENTVTTTAARTPSTISLSGDSLVTCVGTADCAGTIEGDIPVDFEAQLSGRPESVQTFRIEDPVAFARIAFIEALERAGVTVETSSALANPTDALPAANSYAPQSRVAEFSSPPYSEYAKLILKVSLNLGANLSLMLFGLAHGQRTIADALAVERQTLISRMGIEGDAFDFPTNGSGSPDSQATARATVQMLAEMGKSAVGPIYKASLPVLGVDGSLANSGVTMPARGHVFAKTGTTLDQNGLKAQNLAGYIDSKNGRRLAFAIFANDAGPIEQISDVAEVFEDEAAIANAIYEAC
jgi:PBP4 family serine-type D-alanyl-D-alanine carboxypeptidase